MKFITLLTALTAVLPAVLANLTINTPTSVVSCEPSQLQWSGGASPYYLSVVPAGQPSATPFEQFPAQNGTTFTWNVDLAQGVSFTIVLKDSTGGIAYSDIVTVGPGPSTTCINKSVSASGSTATSGSGATTGAAQATGTSATDASSPSSSSSGTSTAASSSPTHSSGAGRLDTTVSAFGVAGVMGLLGAMLF